MALTGSILSNILTALAALGAAIGPDFFKSDKGTTILNSILTVLEVAGQVIPAIVPGQHAAAAPVKSGTPAPTLTKAQVYAAMSLGAALGFEVLSSDKAAPALNQILATVDSAS